MSEKSIEYIKDYLVQKANIESIVLDNKQNGNMDWHKGYLQAIQDVARAVQYQEQEKGND